MSGKRAFAGSDEIPPGRAGQAGGCAQSLEANQNRIELVFGQLAGDDGQRNAHNRR